MVRPVDAQQIVLQTNSIEKVQQLQRQHSTLQQQYIELQIKEEKKLAKEIVQDSAETEKAVIKDKEKEEEKKRQSQQSTNKRIEKNNKEANVDMDDEFKEMGRFIDIKV